MNYKDFTLGDWIGHISGVIEDESELDGNEMRDLVEFLSRLPMWIPVSERLPEEGKEVLVYYKYFRYGDYNCMYPAYSVGFQYNGIWGGDVRGHKLNVIAWTPLPKPYEGKRGNEDGSN